MNARRPVVERRAPDRPSNGTTRTCPKCHTHQMDFNERYRLSKRNGKFRTVPAWVCDSAACGYRCAARSEDELNFAARVLRVISKNLRSKASRVFSKRLRATFAEPYASGSLPWQRQIAEIALMIGVFGSFAVWISLLQAQQAQFTSERTALDIVSSVDGSSQRSYLVVPPGLPEGPRPLLVVLHAWGANNEGRSPTIESEATTRGWFVLAPNFRGPSDHPQGCGSAIAQQDILDAVAYVRGRFPIDRDRIYLMGYSGGGFMTLLMAARHPEMWAAASAWAGIADLSAWYEETSESIRTQLRGCFGGAPSEVNLSSRYREQSPVAYLRPSLSVPIEIAHGDHDPQVAVRHALRAFELLAPGTVSAVEREEILSGKVRASSDPDPLIKANIRLRRVQAAFRLTIYDGGHDYYPRAGMAWLSLHQRR